MVILTPPETNGRIDEDEMIRVAGVAREIEQRVKTINAWQTVARIQGTARIGRTRKVRVWWTCEFERE